MFDSSHRLKNRADFTRCYESGRKYFSANFVVFVYTKEESFEPWRLGMAVGRKTGNAVRRNRLRRLIRECFRLRQQYLPDGVDIVVVPKRSLDPALFCLSRVDQELMALIGCLK